MDNEDLATARASEPVESDDDLPCLWESVKQAKGELTASKNKEADLAQQLQAAREQSAQLEQKVRSLKERIARLLGITPESAPQPAPQPAPTPRAAASAAAPPVLTPLPPAQSMSPEDAEETLKRITGATKFVTSVTPRNAGPIR